MAQLGLCEQVLRRILHLNLHMYPYKIQTVFKLEPIDIQRHLQYVQIVTKRSGSKTLLLDNFDNEEQSSCLSSQVNKQNRLWGTENPQE